MKFKSKNKEKYIDINNTPPLTKAEVDELRQLLEGKTWESWGVWSHATPQLIAQLIARIDRLELLLSQARHKADIALQRLHKLKEGR